MDNWNPLTDTVPIHSWIHPWLPLLRARLEPLYPPIRSKLSNALQQWHPGDTSARLILQPWKDVFTPGAWEAFMVKNIIPKLGMSLNMALPCKNMYFPAVFLFHVSPFAHGVASFYDGFCVPRQRCVWRSSSSTLTSSRWSHLTG